MGSTSRTVSNQIKGNKSHVLDSIVFFFHFVQLFCDLLANICIHITRSALHGKWIVMCKYWNHYKYDGVSRHPNGYYNYLVVYQTSQLHQFELKMEKFLHLNGHSHYLLWFKHSKFIFHYLNCMLLFAAAAVAFPLMQMHCGFLAFVAFSKLNS